MSLALQSAMLVGGQARQEHWEYRRHRWESAQSRVFLAIPMFAREKRPRNRTRGYAAGSRMSSSAEPAGARGSSEGADCPDSAAVQATVR